jgi:hypothetical protein
VLGLKYGKNLSVSVQNELAGSDVRGCCVPDMAACVRVLSCSWNADKKVGINTRDAVEWLHMGVVTVIAVPQA